MKEAILAILRCKPEEVEKEATRFDVPLPTARGLRLQWIRKLTGLCAFCGKKVESGSLCRGCRARKEIDPRSVREFLMEYHPQQEIMSYPCRQCGKPIRLTAMQLLKRYGQYGVLRKKTLCNRCREDRCINHPRMT